MDFKTKLLIFFLIIIVAASCQVNNNLETDEDRINEATKDTTENEIDNELEKPDKVIDDTLDVTAPCIDSDDGIDYTQKGSVTIISLKDEEQNKEVYYDSCDKTILLENYCGGEKRFLTRFSCPDQCHDGKCVTGLNISDAVVELKVNSSTSNSSCLDLDKDGFPSPDSGFCNIILIDCNDNNANVYPGANETCGNNIDDNCDNIDISCAINCTDMDNDGFGYPASNSCAKSAIDCNDNKSNIYPDATEVCGNGIDENCNGADSTCLTFCNDLDNDGYGKPASSACQFQSEDCNDNDRNINIKKIEICGNGIDEDCNGSDLICTVTCSDLDRDGYGKPASASCNFNALDCNDNNVNINPGKTEICGNNIDDNCDGNNQLCTTGKTYFVSTSGNDANSGTSSNSPWKTIQKCANIANSGDMCNVMAGTYAEHISIIRAGITFKAQGLVKVKSFAVSTDNTIVDGFYSLNSDAYHGAIIVNGNSNIIRNNIIEGACMTGIGLSRNNNLAENNEIFKSRQCFKPGTNELVSGADADGIRIFDDGNIVRGNYIHDLSLIQNPTAHIDCFQSWGTLTNAIIEHNICDVIDPTHASSYKAGMQTDIGNVHNIIIRNNIFRAVRGLNIRGEGIKVTNNVFIGDNQPTSYVFFAEVENTIIQNNIVYNTATGILTGAGITQGGYNIVYNDNGIAPRRDSGYSGNNGNRWPTDKWQTVNPMFVNPSTGDYHLQPNSPACTLGKDGTYVGAYPCGSIQATTCTSNDWSYSDGVCQPSNTLTRTWTKITSCLGGVSHLATELKSCNVNSGNNYYVSTTGNDNNPGTSETVPWKTLAKVKSMSFSPGDKILLKAGGVWNEGMFNFPSSGSSNGNIVFGRYGTGVNPVINSDTYSAIKISDKSYITIDGIDIKNAESSGITIIDSGYITIRNVYITHVGGLSGAISFGDGLNSHDILVEDFKFVGGGRMGWGFSGAVRNFIMRRGTIDGAGQAAEYQTHGMYISDWHDFIVEDVNISRSWNAGIKIVGNTYNGVFQRVKVTESGRSGSSGPGVSFGDSNSDRKPYIHNLKFENCIIANSKSLAFWNIDGLNNVQNITINHCTLINNVGSINFKSGSAGWIVTNNIGYEDTTWNSNNLRNPLMWDSESNVQKNYFNNNDWYFKNGAGSYIPVKIASTTISFSQWQAKSSHPDAHSLSVDPKFVNPASGDFHLQSGSPACTAGEGGTYIGAYPCSSNGETAINKLTWMPPELNNPIIFKPTNEDPTLWNDPNTKPYKDCLIEMPDYALNKGVNIYYCNNVVIIGGEINIPNQGPNPDIPSRRMLVVQGATGIVHIEGMWGHGEDISEGIVGFSRDSIIQIQNVRIDHIKARDQVGFTDNHPDLVQSWGNAKEIKIDRFTGSSDYQGFMLKADDGYPHGPIIIKNTNIIGDPTARYQFWIGHQDQGDITLENFWMDVPPQRSNGLCNSVWPACTASLPFKSIINQDEQGREYATFPSSMTPKVSGRITEGTPLGGDFVPLGTVGINYVSPGYI